MKESKLAESSLVASISHGIMVYTGNQMYMIMETSRNFTGDKPDLGSYRVHSTNPHIGVSPVTDILSVYTTTHTILTYE